MDLGGYFELKSKSLNYGKIQKLDQRKSVRPVNLGV